MRNYELSPLFRSSVGFDQLNRIFDSAFNVDENAVSYPPYNIVRLDEDLYEIAMAVAGFVESDLDITVTEKRLVISGKHAGEEIRDDATYLHRGIAARAFERRFQLADHVKVVNAVLNNGLLTVEVPESKKPYQISIRNESAPAPAVIEVEAA